MNHYILLRYKKDYFILGIYENLYKNDKNSLINGWKRVAKRTVDTIDYDILLVYEWVYQSISSTICKEIKHIILTDYKVFNGEV